MSTSILCCENLDLDQFTCSYFTSSTNSHCMTKFEVFCKALFNITQGASCLPISAADLKLCLTTKRFIRLSSAKKTTSKQIRETFFQVLIVGHNVRIQLNSVVNVTTNRCESELFLKKPYNHRENVKYIFSGGRKSLLFNVCGIMDFNCFYFQVPKLV